MRAFHLTAENALLFFEICHELKADTEEKRVAVLDAMAELGKIGFAIETPKTKEEYVQHLAKNFNVMRVSPSATPKEP